MPDCSWGLSTRAVVLSSSKALTPDPATSPKESLGKILSVEWMERFLLRLPYQLCEDLVSQNGNPQFLGSPIEVREGGSCRGGGVLARALVHNLHTT
jgi:hypothetical protein